MARIDLEKLANEYGLHVEKRDLGYYRQFKDAEVMIFLDAAHTGGPAMLRADYVPQRSEFGDQGDISIWSNLFCDKTYQPDIPKFHRHECLLNDDFNERAIREIIEKTLGQYRSIKVPDIDAYVQEQTKAYKYVFVFDPVDAVHLQETHTLDIIKTSNADDVIRWIYGMIHHDFKEEVLESSVVIIYQFDTMTPENGDMETARKHLVKLIEALTPLGPVVQFKL